MSFFTWYRNTVSSVPYRFLGGVTKLGNKRAMIHDTHPNDFLSSSEIELSERR